MKVLFILFLSVVSLADNFPTGAEALTLTNKANLSRVKEEILQAISYTQCSVDVYFKGERAASFLVTEYLNKKGYSYKLKASNLIQINWCKNE